MEYDLLGNPIEEEEEEYEEADKEYNDFSSLCESNDKSKPMNDLFGGYKL